VATHGAALHCFRLLLAAHLGPPRSSPTSPPSLPPTAPTTSATAASSSTTPASSISAKTCSSTPSSAASTATNSTCYFDRNVFPRLDKLIAHLAKTRSPPPRTNPAAARRLPPISTTAPAPTATGAAHFRSVCAWCADVYGYLAATKAADRKRHEKSLQATIDLESSPNTDRRRYCSLTDREDRGHLSPSAGRQQHVLLRRRPAGALAQRKSDS